MGYQKSKRPLSAPGFSDGTALAQAAIVSLTSAQLKTMYTTPVNIIPAPGAGSAIIVETVLFKMVTTATAYTGGGVVQFQYHTSPNAVVHQGTIPATTVTAAAGTSYSSLGAASGTNALLAAINDGVDITNQTAVFASGTGTARVYIRYWILGI